MVSTWYHKDESGNSTPYLSVNNGAMTYMLINAVKEQQEIIDQQKQNMSEQQQQIDFLMKELSELKSVIVADDNPR